MPHSCARLPFVLLPRWCVRTTSVGGRWNLKVRNVTMVAAAPGRQCPPACDLPENATRLELETPRPKIHFGGKVCLCSRSGAGEHKGSASAVVPKTHHDRSRTTAADFCRSRHNADSFKDTNREYFVSYFTVRVYTSTQLNFLLFIEGCI